MKRIVLCIESLCMLALIALAVIASPVLLLIALWNARHEAAITRE